jgi:ABC-type transport system substrate-binding protein
LRLTRSPGGTDELVLPGAVFDLANARAEMAQSRAGLLERIGIKAELQPLPIGAWLAAFDGPRENIGLWAAGVTSRGDLGAIPKCFFHSKNAVGGRIINMASYRSPAAVKLIDSGQQTYDSAKR